MSPQQMGKASGDAPSWAAGLIKMVRSLVDRIEEHQEKNTGTIHRLECTIQQQQHTIQDLESTVKELHNTIHTLLGQQPARPGFQPTLEATNQLQWLLGSSKVLRAESVRACLDGGADTLYWPHGWERPLLHTLVVRGEVEAIEAIMAHPAVVDLRAEDRDGHNVLELMSSKCPLEAVEPMLQAVVERKRNPVLGSSTIVKWGQQNDAGEDVVLSEAARNGRLSHVWKFFKYTPFYRVCTSPQSIKLSSPVDSEDWNRLDSASQKCFLTVEAQRATVTSELLSICATKKWEQAEVKAVQDCISRGADVTFKSSDMDRPILSELLLQDLHPVALLCLESPVAIDFTASTNAGNTPLHVIAWYSKNSVQSMQALLRAVIRHVASHREDRIDWSLKDKWGHECISTAAYYGHLYEWWEVVKAGNVSYYMQHDGPIHITWAVSSADYERLSWAEQQHFVLEKGLEK